MLGHVHLLSFAAYPAASANKNYLVRVEPMTHRCGNVTKMFHLSDDSAHDPLMGHDSNSLVDTSMMSA